ncbi:hypothetical protein [Rhizobium sp. RHZ01]|uniref:EF-hand domain-containing protein n=1 Tax=Rhizobium sp. RHZ01 TaxID=2769304 RepID=UPI00177E0FC7|nr:hypothetical protein [Rhizobium sp. RHZ01]MBD9447298.1 hypothetical protein [Rhizobium sp. RHZ01]
MRKAFIWAAAMASIGGIGLAQETPESKRPPDVLVRSSLIAHYREAYISMVMSVLRQGAQDHQTLTNIDIERKKAIDKAGRTSAVMAEFFGRDVNADRVVDAQEFSNLREEIWSRAGLLRADANADGKVSLDEAFTYAQNQSDDLSGDRSSVQLEKYLELDPNKDGKLTADELQELATAAFAYFDKDGDGLLSPTEKRELQARSEMITRADRLERQCRLPKATARQKVYLITAYEGGTLSNVSIVGQDEVTEIATIEIAAGSEPIYLAVSSFTPMIWRLTGHVERVTTFYGTGWTGVGVTGVSKDVVTLVSDRECSRRFEGKSGSATTRQFLQALTSLIGHDIDGMISRYTSFSMALPSDFRAVTDEVEDGRSAKEPDFSLDGLPSQDGIMQFKQTLANLRSFSPGGVLNIDAKDVIATRIAEPYRILPQQAGLLQLLQNGSLVERGRDTYVAMRAFARYPAGLAGAHSVTFQFPEGMKLPEGKPGHSKVYVGKSKQLPMVLRP